MPSRGNRFRIIEVAALPGSGKTAICRAIEQRLGPGHRSLVSSHRRLLRRSRLFWLALPFALARYGGVLRALSAAGASAGMTRFLTSSMFERFLLRAEVVMRRRFALVDEGQVQRGLGLLMRVPSERRGELWAAYLAALPRGQVCLVLRCSPEEAVRRAEAGSRGLPEPLRGCGDAVAQYRELAAFLEGEPLASRLRCVVLNAEPAAAEVAAALCAEFSKLAPLERAIVFLRDKQQG